MIISFSLLSGGAKFIKMIDILEYRYFRIDNWVVDRLYLDKCVKLN